MGGSLIRRVTGASGIGYGVNIWELAPPKVVAGNSTNVIGMVAELPWGPVDEVTTITSPGEFWSTFYPNAFAESKDYTTYPAILALLNKPIFTRGGLKVVRVGAASQANSLHVFQDTVPADSVTATAKYPGLLGDQITVEFTANADDATARDMTVSIGANYSETYEAVVAPDGAGGITVTDPGDTYVTITAIVAAAGVPAVGSSALSGGSDGTAVATDYTGSSSSAKGVRIFYGASVDVSVLFVAECPTGVLDAVNTGLMAFETDTDKGVAVLCTVAGQTSADAMTYIPTYRDDRLSYHGPRVKTTNFFDPAAAEIVVDGNAFAAAAIANVEPWLSPGGAGGNGFLTGITGLEDESWSRATLDSLNALGIAPWFISNKLGTIIRRAVNTSITSGQTKIFRRRMTDYLVNSIADFAESYTETQLDLILADQVLGPNTEGFMTAIRSFLEGEQTALHIQAYELDPFSGNTAADIDAGRWTVLMSIKLYGMAEEIVLKANVGETVEISQA